MAFLQRWKAHGHAVSLLIVCRALGVMSADCVPYPIAAPITNVSLSNGHVARGVALSVGTPAQDFAFLPQWSVQPCLDAHKSL